MTRRNTWLLWNLFRLPLRDRTRAKALPLLLEKLTPGGPRNDVGVPRVYDDADDYGDGYGETGDWVPRLYSGPEDDATITRTGVR